MTVINRAKMMLDASNDACILMGNATAMLAADMTAIIIKGRRATSEETMRSVSTSAKTLYAGNYKALRLMSLDPIVLTSYFVDYATAGPILD